MSYLIAAAGTGGHVFPGLAVGEALVDLGVPRQDVVYVGGDRLEASVYPGEGFPFLSLELRGLERSASPRNLALPLVVYRAKRRIEEAMAEREVVSALGMGGYVTVPTGLAARKLGIPISIAEQNAEAGLANRVVARWADHCFVSFPGTGGLAGGEWVGNPVRRPFWSFDRGELRPKGLARYGLAGDRPVLGVFGGSLGAGSINEAVASMLSGWPGDPIDVVHLTGTSHEGRMAKLDAADGVNWVRVGFEAAMELFYAVSSLVVARGGGAVAELTATGTPSILVPGTFGSTGHQEGNARYLVEHGAAVALPQPELGRLGELVERIMFDWARLGGMAEAAAGLARPEAARTIARAMMGGGS